MDKFIDLLCSPKLGVILFVLLLAYLLAQGCSDVRSRSPRRG